MTSKLKISIRVFFWAALIFPAADMAYFYFFIKSPGPIEYICAIGLNIAVMVLFGYLVQKEIKRIEQDRETSAVTYTLKDYLRGLFLAAVLLLGVQMVCSNFIHEEPRVSVYAADLIVLIGLVCICGYKIRKEIKRIEQEEQ